MNNEINDWLHSLRDYDSGFELLARFSGKRHLVRVIDKLGECQENLDTIAYELSLLKDIPNENPSKRIPAPPVLPEPVKVPGEFEDPFPHAQADQILFTQIKEKLKYRDILHAGLEFCTENQRRENALLILDISDQISEDYERHEHFKKHGVLPQEKTAEIKPPSIPVNELTEAQLVKRKTNIRSKISFYKKLINDPLLISKLNHNTAAFNSWEKELAETLKLLSK